MDPILVVKLVASFFAGGSVIALLSFLVEKASKRVAGIIISIPSTIVVGYIFIAWTLSPQAIAEITPASVVGSMGVLLFATAYLALSKLKLTKKMSLAVSLSGALFVWAIFAIPAALFEITDLGIALLGYALALVFSYYFLTIKNTATDNKETLTYTTSQKIGRAAFAGFVISFGVLLANVLNPLWGGVFSVFPAVFTSTFSILHWYYGPQMIHKIMKQIPKGSIIFTTFAVAAGYTYPAFGILLGTLAAYAASAVPFLLFYKR